MVIYSPSIIMINVSLVCFSFIKRAQNYSTITKKKQEGSACRSLFLHIFFEEITDDIVPSSFEVLFIKVRIVVDSKGFKTSMCELYSCFAAFRKKLKCNRRISFISIIAPGIAQFFQRYYFCDLTE